MKHSEAKHNKTKSVSISEKAVYFNVILRFVVLISLSNYKPLSLMCYQLCLQNQYIDGGSQFLFLVYISATVPAKR